MLLNIFQQQNVTVKNGCVFSVDSIRRVEQFDECGLTARSTDSVPWKWRTEYSCDVCYATTDLFQFVDFFFRFAFIDGDDIVKPTAGIFNARLNYINIPGRSCSQDRSIKCFVPDGTSSGYGVRKRLPEWVETYSKSVESESRAAEPDPSCDSNATQPQTSSLWSRLGRAPSKCVRWRAPLVELWCQILTGTTRVFGRPIDSNNCKALYLD